MVLAEHRHLVEEGAQMVELRIFRVCSPTGRAPR
jgi:hypothetical protein